MRSSSATTLTTIVPNRPTNASHLFSIAPPEDDPI
jgi:hypothetical protein